MTPQDPLDDRLRSYLRERAAVKVPPGLVANALTSAGHPPSRLRGWLRTAGASAALVLFFLTVGRQLLGPLFQPVGDGPPAIVISVPTPVPTQTTAAASAAPSSSASSSPLASSPVPSDNGLASAGFPATVLGLPVISVADARALIADGGYQGRAMAVGGWWSRSPFAMSCPPSLGYEPPIVGRCALEALSPNDRVAGHRSSDGNSYSWGPPPGSILARDVPETSGKSEPWKNVDPQSDARELPQRVVVVAHSGDMRALQCVVQTIPSCEQELVIDAFAWVEGQSTDATGDTSGTWNLSAQQARSAIEATLPGGQVVAFDPIAAEEVQLVDPRIPIDTAPIWIGRVITGPPDAEGTAPLTEVLVSDATSLTQTLPMAPAPDQLPATVELTGVGSLFDSNGAPTVLLAISGQGRRVTEVRLDRFDTPPAVLAAGDYRIDVWASDPASEDPIPSIPPSTSCAAPLHVTTGEVATVTITLLTTNSCAIGPPGPTPTTGP